MNNRLQANISPAFFDHNDFSAFANALAQGLLIVNEHGKIVFANQHAQEICGLESTNPALHISYQEKLQECNETIHDVVHQCFHDQTNSERQVTIREKIYLISCKPVFSNLKFEGCVVSFADITNTIAQQRQHHLLYQISSAFSSTGPYNLNQVLTVAVNQILQSMNITSANIMLLDLKTGELKIEVDTNKHKASYIPRSILLGEGLAGRCAKELRPYSAYDVATSELYVKKCGKDHGALLVVPIASKGKLIGVINVADKSPRYFTESEVQFLTIIANEIAIAIDNSTLYKRLTHKIEILSKFSWVSSFIGMNNIDSRIQRLVRLTAELLEAEGCYIYIFSPTKNKFVLKYRNALDLPIPTEIDINDTKANVLRTVFSEQKTITVNNIHSDHPHPEKLKKIGIYNFISTPFYMGDKPIGVISVFNKPTGDFTEEDRQLLSITTHRVSTKMENAQLVHKLGAEKELLDITIQNISEGVVVLNRRRKVMLWNQYMETLTGIKAKDAIGQPCYKILYNRLGLKKLTEKLYEAAESAELESQGSAEEVMTTVTGDKYWVNSIFSYVLTSNKAIENTIIVLRNTSEEKEFIQAKNEFISLATHELRTPLTAIKGYLSMVLAPSVATNVQAEKKYISKAYQSTERLVDLVEELLDVVRIDENRLTFNCGIFTLGEVIEEAIEELAQKAKSKNLKVSYRSGLPIPVYADREKSKQVIENLIDNAIKYTKTNGTIKITLEKREHEVLIAIKDTGVGIPQRYQNSIFERFVRIDNPLSVKAGGTGLGLYIVKSLVEQQGGKIWLKSEVSKGTTFYITLPLAREGIIKQELREE